MGLSYQDDEKRNDIHAVVDECMHAMLLAWVQQRDYLSEEIPFMKKASRCMGDDRAAEESSTCKWNTPLC